MRSTAKSHSEDPLSWDAAVVLHRELLRSYLDYLIECDCSVGILAKVEAEVRDRSVPDKFKLRFMVRVLMRQVIQHMREGVHMEKTVNGRSHDHSGSAKSLPALERLVYVLRDILEYSTRNTSLLMGITDAHVEKLLSCARKRLDMYDGPSSVKIENLNGTYFRWNFLDLHLH